MSFDRNAAAGTVRILTGLCLILLAGPAAAQPSPEQQSAIRGNCRSDFMANCSSVQPGGPEALQCLQHNVAKLSPACQGAVRAVTPQPAAAAPAAPPQVRPAAATPAAVSAPAAAPQQPTAQQQAAIRQSCQSDFMSRCPGVQPGGADALQCLQRNAAQLSPNCRGAVAAVGPSRAPASATAQRPVPPPSAVPAGPPSTIYVSDFKLDPQVFHADKGGPLQQLRPGLLGNLIKGDIGSKDPAERARGVVDMMARQLVQNLTAAGLNARRLAPGEKPPAQGWLVHGAFTSVDEGNKLQRSTIGMGQGKTDLKVSVAIDDLKSGQPVYQADEGAQSGRMPGSAASAAIKFNPYAMAASFAMSGMDIERNITKTAKEVSDGVVRRARQ